MGNKRRKTLRALILAGMAVCLLLIGRAYYHSVRHRAQQEQLREMVTEKDVEYSASNAGVPDETGISVTDNDENPDAEENGGQTGEEPVILERYAAPYEENKDLAGWLFIENTKIDYPVMQGEDDEYYLHHDFYGEDSKYGSLYVKEQADLDDGTIQEIQKGGHYEKTKRQFITENACGAACGGAGYRHGMGCGSCKRTGTGERQRE